MVRASSLLALCRMLAVRAWRPGTEEVDNAEDAR